jgi:DNA-binding MarR family transcriptional regulator
VPDGGEVLAMREGLGHDALEIVEYRDSPPVHLFGDSDAAVERIRRAAEKAGCRILDASVIHAAAVTSRDCAPNAAALIELDGDGEPDGLVALLDRAQRAAARGGRSVVAGPARWIDLIAARAPHANVDYLCTEDGPDREAAIRWATSLSPSRLQDIGRDEGPVSLQQLSEDAGRIAAVLASLSEEDGAGLVGAKGAAAPVDEPRVDAAYIRAMIRARRLRDQYFRRAMFADPAWDMLLDLMAARLERNRVAVSSLCIAAAVPATTALRWIKALTDQGLFMRRADPQDGRRVYIELSDETARALNAYLRAVQRICPTAV